MTRHRRVMIKKKDKSTCYCDKSVLAGGDDCVRGLFGDGRPERAGTAGHTKVFASNRQAIRSFQ